MENKNKKLKIYEKEYEIQFNDNKDEDIEEKGNYIKEYLSKLLIHQLIKQIKLDKLLWDYDANSLNPSAMWDENSLYPKIETGNAYTPDMKKNS